jgi:hypothetical protein
MPISAPVIISPVAASSPSVDLPSYFWIDAKLTPIFNRARAFRADVP